MSNKKLTLKEKFCYAPLGILLRVVAKFPFSVLYMLADIIAYTAHNIIKYRRSLVRRNLKDCFPELNQAGLRQYEKDFYHHLADYFVETIKLPGMSKKQMQKRMKFENTELIDSLFSKGKSMIIYTSHFGNWEWITSMADWCNTKDAIYAHVYRPLKNKWFDQYFLYLRGIYNFSIPMKNTLRQLVTWRKEGQLSITGFLSDQKPSHAGTTIEVNFFGRPTPFIAGTEELAVKLKMPVLYFDTRIVSRGHYSSRICLITEDASGESHGEITRRYVNNLEETIRRAPGAYLWSHNRWRLNKKDLK